MEQNKEPLEFQIICSDDILIKDVIDKYNKVYKTDFEILKFVYDEVVFCKIRVTKYKISDVFDLGYQFGSYAQFKRQKGEIDW